jgi:hypothetical protein
VVTLKNPTPENKVTFDAMAKNWAKSTEGKWTFGWTGEDSNKAIVISSWDSIEVSF